MIGKERDGFTTLTRRSASFTALTHNSASFTTLTYCTDIIT